MARLCTAVGMLLALVVVLLIAAPSAQADILAQSTFDDPLATFDGWIANEDGGSNNLMTYEATDGQEGGYITADDINDGLTWYWVAPDKFLGDQSAAYGGTLDYYLRQHLSSGDTTDPFQDNDVILEGAGNTLVYVFPTSDAYPVAGDPYPGTGGVWTHYSIPLVETDSNWHVDSVDGDAPTAEQMQATLANLTSLRVRGEYQSGDDHGDLDSVTLNGSSTGSTSTGSMCGQAGSTNLPVLGLMCMLGLCLAKMFIHKSHP